MIQNGSKFSSKERQLEGCGLVKSRDVTNNSYSCYGKETQTQPLDLKNRINRNCQSIRLVYRASSLVALYILLHLSSSHSLENVRVEWQACGWSCVVDGVGNDFWNESICGIEIRTG